MDSATTTALVHAALLSRDLRQARDATRQLLQPGADVNVALDGLTAGLRHADSFVRRRAAQALGLFGVAAMPALLAALRDRHWTVREAVVQALAEMPDDSGAVRSALVDRALHDPGPLVRDSAGKVAVRRGVTATDLRPALRDPRSAVRRRVIRVLGLQPVGMVEVIPLLRTALDDGDVKVRALAASVLGECGSAAVEVLPRLVRAAWEKDDRVRLAAGRSAQRLLCEPTTATLRWLAEAMPVATSPETLLRIGIDRPDLPGRVREEFIAAAGRRRLWYQRRRGPSPTEPARGVISAWEAAIGAADAAEQAGDSRTGEFAWLLGLLCELWLRG